MPPLATGILGVDSSDTEPYLCDVPALDKFLDVDGANSLE